MRVIFEVHAKIIDANGSYNNLTDYPKVFDSRHYDDDAGKTENRAYGAYHEALASMCKIDSRQLQVAFIVKINDGSEIARSVIGGVDYGE